MPMLLSKIEDWPDAPAKHGSSELIELYAPAVHRMVRIAYASMGIALFTLAVRGATAPEGIPWDVIAGGFPVLLLMTLVLAIPLRTCALYGSPEGLEIARWGKRRVVAWSKVGMPKFAWWSFGLWGRIAKVVVSEEKKQTIFFFADSGILVDFETTRARYTRN